MKRHRARWCPGYSELWAGDVRVKLFAALKGYAQWYGQLGGGEVRMVTVTAPGAEALPWDLDHCAHLGDHHHSGDHGCRVLPAAARQFNDLAPAWWSELHRQARQAATRAGSIAPELLIRQWELQKRGVLHLHVAVGYTIPEERQAADLYVQELDRLSARHGFGFVDRKREVKEASQCAAYMSSYFVKGKRGKISLSETVRTRAMPRSIVYVAPWLSRRSGITMRSLRLRRYAYRLWEQIDNAPGLWCSGTPLEIWWALCDGWSLSQICDEFT